ncbi:MAG: hypothetical protein Q8M11_22370 [Sulfuritalea sp.]|nr:hypothetical protein [Sulfuritalea sp.]
MHLRTILRLTLAGTAWVVSAPSHAFLDDLVKSVGTLTAAQGTSADASVARAGTSQKPVLTAKCAQGGKGKDAKNAACAQVSKMTFTRPPDQLDKLLTGEPISGDTLMTEMRALRAAVGTGNLNAAMASMLGPADMAGATSAQASGSGSFLSSMFSAAGDMLLDMLVAELSYKALDAFFATMTDKPGLLNEVKVTLPKADATMTPETKQQLVTMGSFLVAIKASGLVIDASDKDFEDAKASYRKVLDSRTNAAKLLRDAFFDKNRLAASEQEGKVRGKQYVSESALAFLDTMRDVTEEEFSRNPSVQNIALDYLKETNPDEYKRYRTELVEFKTHYGAYGRTAVGAASMVGFSSLFLKRAKNMLEKNGLAAAPALLPLVADGLTEVISVVPRVKSTLERSPDIQDGSFVVRFANGEVKKELPAAKVFSSLEDVSRAGFQAELFVDGRSGYFGQLGNKYPLMAGRILDSLVEKDNRKAIVADYLGEEDLPDFSFQNALGGTGRKGRELKAALFTSAPAEGVADKDLKAIALVQNDVRNKLKSWDNSMLRQIMYANRDPKKPTSELALNGAVIDIDSPGMKGIMEYDEMAVVGGAHTENRKAESDRPGRKSKAGKPVSKTKK